MDALTLVIPGLQGITSLSATEQRESQHPALTRWLGRGVRLRHLPSGYERMLLALAGYSVAPGEDVPVAAFARLGDGQPLHPGWWMRADPVHLRADRDRLILFPPGALDLTQSEAQSLAEVCNRLFIEDGWRVEALHPRRWYLHLDQDPGIRTYDLAEAIGKTVGDFLPRGVQRRRWQTVLTEVQMMLHGAETNTARQTRGQLAANGLWLWGSGALPAVQPLPWHSVWTEEPFAAGLARHSQVCCEAPGAAEQVIDAARRGPTILAWHGAQEAWASGDKAGYLAAVRSVCDAWIAPVYEAVRAKRLTSALLATDGGLAVRIDASVVRRFWRRGGQLSDSFAALALGE